MVYLFSTLQGTLQCTPKMALILLLERHVKDRKQGKLLFFSLSHTCNYLFCYYGGGFSINRIVLIFSLTYIKPFSTWGPLAGTHNVGKSSHTNHVDWFRLDKWYKCAMQYEWKLFYCKYFQAKRSQGHCSWWCSSWEDVFNK